MDALDRRLLDLLREDGRASYQELGPRVGLSASAVKRRVDRMTADGVIRGFTVVTDPEAVGHGTEAYVELFCRGIVGPQELRRILTGIPEVIEATTVTGQADALVTLRAADTRHLELALEKVRSPSQVDSTRSAIVLSRLIERRA
ncbi:Lrp/AsnC family transcriptional regulator [Demequina sp. NBRC 110057]|uniref:Lrp/AsnC family transcriptional regulator n=1 Tax=Demequina sp. NBRC 110057 TaxID=1570346 RepID=UPI000A037517|nr:Lrp/AsnC family transcriptional regulator [Demequina sp. NBRC 110057]